MSHILFSHDDVCRVFVESLGIQTLNNEGSFDGTEEVYDGFELQMLHIYKAEDGCIICEPTTPEELSAEVENDNFQGVCWTVYAHVKKGGVDALHDFITQDEAEEAYKTLCQSFNISTD